MWLAWEAAGEDDASKTWDLLPGNILKGTLHSLTMTLKCPLGPADYPRLSLNPNKYPSWPDVKRLGYLDLVLAFVGIGMGLTGYMIRNTCGIPQSFCSVWVDWRSHASVRHRSCV